jgi:translocator protein
MTSPTASAFSRSSLLALAASFALCFGVSVLGGAITAGPVKSWYPTIAKPAITPPDIAFPIVWTLLFAMMAVAAWLVWRRGGWPGARPALLLFGLQLALNLGWSALFFGLQRIGLALAEIALLWLAIAATMVAFFRHDRTAGWLFVPYLAWVSFAAVLNALIWRMNI